MTPTEQKQFYRWLRKTNYPSYRHPNVEMTWNVVCAVLEARNKARIKRQELQDEADIVNAGIDSDYK